MYCQQEFRPTENTAAQDNLANAEEDLLKKIVIGADGEVTITGAGEDVTVFDVGEGLLNIDENLKKKLGIATIIFIIVILGIVVVSLGIVVWVVLSF
jgi:predicted methyltransferase